VAAIAVAFPQLAAYDADEAEARMAAEMAT
jgi:hypothetical protein